MATRPGASFGIGKRTDFESIVTKTLWRFWRAGTNIERHKFGIAHLIAIVDRYRPGNIADGFLQIAGQKLRIWIAVELQAHIQLVAGKIEIGNVLI